jgi:alkyldihydroxyacetonephosphate synthase
MKWYGWGAEGEAFNPVDRPHLWPYAKQHLGITHDQPLRRPVPLAKLTLPLARRNTAFLEAIAQFIALDRISTHDEDRLLHAYGKSTRDLWRIRNGYLDFAPDCVIFPISEDEVLHVIQEASRADVVIIPFGGGSNIAGCIELQRPSTRMVATMNLRLMARVIDIDKLSRTARVQPGLLGPDLERELNAAGFTLGHFPDSFNYSTVGGWVATRSSGMLSDRYGNVEDMVLSLRMATPTGMIQTATVPHASNGPDINRLCIGSEGTLGVITELTLRLHDAPARREFRGYLFPDWNSGLAAIRECQRRDCFPDLTRLNDPPKTQLSAAFRRRSGPMAAAITRLAKYYLRAVRRFDLDSSCLLIAAFDGTRQQTRRRRAAAERVYRAHGGCSLGRGPGESFADGKFDFPHLRDFLFDYGVICDVAETSTTWAKVNDLYLRVRKCLSEALARDNHVYWLGCHLSHSYPSGAALYFTFGFRCQADPSGKIDQPREFDHYLRVKQTALEAFQANGATFSHHHAVGYEHLPWLTREAALSAGTVIDAIKPVVDPTDIMNPGKLRSGHSLSEWRVIGSRRSNHGLETDSQAAI